jgi:hypothetical protein
MRYQIGYAMHDGNTYTLGVGGATDCLRVAERRIKHVEELRQATCPPGRVPMARAYFITEDGNEEAGDQTERDCACSTCTESGPAYEPGDDGRITA